MNLKNLFGPPKVDPLQALADELRDQNRLLRAVLEAQGVQLPSRQTTPPIPPKKRTARDVTVVTREMIWEQEQKDEADRSRSLAAPPDSIFTDTARAEPTEKSATKNGSDAN